MAAADQPTQPAAPGGQTAGAAVAAAAAAAGDVDGGAPRRAREVHHLRGHRGAVLCLASGGADSPWLLASASEDGTARVWDVRGHGGRSVRLLSGMDGEVTGVSFVPGEPHTVLAACGTDLHWYDLRKEAVVLKRPRHTLAGVAEDDVNQVTASPNGKYAAVAEDAGRAVVVDLKARKAFKALRGRHDNLCMAAAFRPTRPWEVATAGLDQRVLLWDFSRGVAYREESAAEAAAAGGGGSVGVNPPMVNALATHPGDGLLAAAVGTGDVALYDLVAKEWAGVLHGHHAPAACVHFPHFSPDGRHLLSAANDRTVVLWDLERSADASRVLAKAAKKGKKNKRKKNKAGGQAKAKAAAAAAAADGAAGPEFLRLPLRLRPGDEDTLDTGVMVDRIRLAEKPNWLTTAGDPSSLRVYVADATPVIRCFQV